MSTHISFHTGGILHVCGGDPKQMDNLHDGVMYSPRMWR